MPSPLENILQDMWRGFDAKLYYPALLVALTLPEICSGLALKNSDFIKQKHYVDFIDKYAENLNLGVSGPQCYQLRGGVVHRANAAAHPHFDATHVIFTVPETGLAFHSFSVLSADESEKATMIDLRTFCTVMDAAVRNWFAENGQSTQVAANISSLISWRPDGILPFADGAPVVGSGPP